VFLPSKSGTLFYRRKLAWPPLHLNHQLINSQAGGARQLKRWQKTTEKGVQFAGNISGLGNLEGF